MSGVCPQCGHDLEDHNDAGTIRGGQGEMCCYARKKGPQFLPSGEPNVCGCSYNGPGTHRYGSAEPTSAQIGLRQLDIL